MLGDIFSPEGFSNLLLSLPAVLWAITFHEFCHGYAAKLLGDKTAEREGRLSLNPLDHLDPIGALCLLLFRFGWAKPVPIDTRFFKNPKRDIIIVSLAGIAGNLFTAFVFAQLWRFFPWLFDSNWALRQFMLLMIFINIGLAAFNIIPIPPLDGSRILYVMLPYKWLKGYYFLEHYGLLFILPLIALGILQRIMNAISLVMIRILLI